ALNSANEQQKALHHSLTSGLTIHKSSSRPVLNLHRPAPTYTNLHQSAPNLSPAVRNLSQAVPSYTKPIPIYTEAVPIYTNPHQSDTKLHDYYTKALKFSSPPLFLRPISSILVEQNKPTRNE
ncbi:MAG: hypothetical protein ACPGWR_34210, partial [Ardenticatenaceae bacterium]